jgi:hypothetical protein
VHQPVCGSAAADECAVHPLLSLSLRCSSGRPSSRKRRDSGGKRSVTHEPAGRAVGAARRVVKLVCVVCCWCLVLRCCGVCGVVVGSEASRERRGLSGFTFRQSTEEQCGERHQACSETRGDSAREMRGDTDTRANHSPSMATQG